MRWLGSSTDSVDMMSLGKLQEFVKERETRCAAVHAVSKSWLQLNDGSHMLTPLTFQTPVRYCSSQHWAFTARRIHS